MIKRGSGILLHITSLPSSYGIGDLGPGAYRFADFLTKTAQCFWQILPINPTCTAYGNSPYSSYSAFAGNSLLISPDLMVEDGFLSKSNIKGHSSCLNERVDYRAVTKYKKRVFQIAYDENKKRIEKDHEFERFCAESSCWLDDYALFIALKEHFKGVIWSNWPEDLRDREKGTIKKWEERLTERMSMEKFIQYIFFRQWSSLKNYCNSKNIQIIGDMPISVNYDSSDVWANPEIFKLDRKKRPIFVAGVPPGYFSSTGQLWGHAVYKWDVLKETQYSWWVKRIEHNLKLFDMFRLDHFRGFVAYWEVRANEKTAINGRWVKAPVKDFFNTLFKHFPYLPIIAEDLGHITPDVREIIDLFGFPGMRVLLFAFRKNFPASPHLPHNYAKNRVVYPGIHDNNTIKGWFRKEVSPEEKKRIYKYIGRKVSGKEIHLEFIRLVMMSIADIVIISMQDILGLGEEARMNRPSTSKGNWKWRLLRQQLTPSLTKRFLQITKIYGRG